MKKGYTLIEIIISIAILGSIMAAVGTLFFVALKNFRTETQKAVFQRELNFAVDAINNDVKEAAVVPSTYDTFELNQTTLILAVPATDSSDNFVYNGGVFEYDYVIYYLSNGSLYKKIYANQAGSRTSSDNAILKNVSALSFNYSPGIVNASQVETVITQSIEVGKTVTMSEKRKANLRNKQ